MEDYEKQSSASILMEWGKKYQSQFILSIFFAVIGVAGGIVPYFCAAQMVGGLLEGNDDFHFYVTWCGTALAGYLVKIIFSCTSTSISHKATYRSLKDLRIRLIKKLTRLPMGTILDTPSGQYKTVIVERVEGMEPTLAHLIPEMTANLLIPIFIFIYLFILDWRMAFISIITLIVGMAVMMYGMRGYAKRYEGAVLAGRKMVNAIIEYINGIEVIKTFNQSAGSYKKYADAVSYNGNYYIDWMRDNQKTMCAYQAILPANLLTVLPAGLYFWATGSIAFHELLTIIILALGIIGPIMAAFTFTDDIAVLGANVAEINDILNAGELNRSETDAILDGSDIQLNNVSFTYGTGNEQALDHVSLRIPAGTMTALVGPSGSGKSTLAKLIAGFWDVTEGEIHIGGVEMKQIPVSQLNCQIAYVSQDTYLFNRSIRENIRMGNLNASDEEVEEVAKRAGCDEFIRKLEHGYDTLVGTAGSSLSGGERQRITIARAMLKNAPIVILDEATAAMDPENEAEIQRALSSLTKGKTLIIIAHRLSTIVDADQIVVVNHGRIEAAGRQDELLLQCPLYQEMWNAHMDVKDQA
ncbi:ABC transporter ATP-binding protein [Lacrimispora indolis]|uniref:ABC transporter ATP-binding protein n=1 Tax=Lacrimispora indolis TaxID=69825 RepID=UPI00045EAEEE|nr:ABC transporter ATP-binding protein [Lacrimispora indolis]